MTTSRSQLMGSLFCAVVAVSFAFNTVFASIAYRDGANAMSVLTYRTLLALIAVFVLLRVWRVPMYLTPRKRLAACGLGLLMATYCYGLLAAIEHMPVALAVLTFYLYPLLTGVISGLLGYERLTPGLIVALVAGFVGLAFALDIGGGGLNLTGFALAGSGALLMTLMVFLNNKVAAGEDSRRITLYVLSTATLAYLVIDLVLGEYRLPQTAEGMLAFLGVGLFFAFSIIGIFVSFSKIGMVQTTMIMNLEPVTSVFLGTVLLGQSMKLSQFGGAALVIAAVVFNSWRKRAAAQ
jgi:probable blue pigment (indigoidine) exporter